MNLKLDKNSLISIVMPTYNQAEFLSSSINSVLNQTITNWELLIVDNFSSDETTNILASYSDPRVKVFQINNGGIIAKSRNFAINAAEGAWIAFLDSDDYWFPNKLEKVSKYFNLNYDLIYHHMKVVIDKDRIINSEFIKSRKLKKPILKDLITNGNPIATSSVVVRKKLLKEINFMSEAPQLIGIEDYNTWLRISNITEAFKLVPVGLGVYRKHENNNSLFKGIDLHVKAFEEFLPRLSSREKKILNLNQMYNYARLKYLDENYNDLKKELTDLVIKGKASHKFKALWMLINLFKI
jgi:glycosyltransferase involved in cell wall biosynthesis